MQEACHYSYSHIISRTLTAAAKSSPDLLLIMGKKCRTFGYGSTIIAGCNDPAKTYVSEKKYPVRYN
jgi:hypothetical protein